MAAKSGRKWILALLLAVVFPALAVHVSCVAVMGPGNWGSGMEEKAPRWLSIEPGSPVTEYIREFTTNEPDEPPGLGDDAAPEAALREFGSSITGKIFWSDYVPAANMGVLATHEGRTWVERQHFYLWRNGESLEPPQQEQAAREPPAQPKEEAGSEEAAAGQLKLPPMRELDLPSEMVLERPTLMKRGDAILVVIERWNHWAIPPLEKLWRYLRSYADPELRPERSLYLYRLPAGPLEYWGPGHTVKPSPDRRFAILLRSGALAAGYYSMHLWDFEQDRLTPIVSLREADPGSGRSFDYEWSRDSRAVHITGTTSGFERRNGRHRSLDLIYRIGEEGLYDLTQGGNRPAGSALGSEALSHQQPEIAFQVGEKKRTLGLSSRRRN